MKSKITTMVIAILALISFQTSYAQLGSVIPKADLVKSFNDVGDLGFSSDKSEKLKEQNEGFVNDIFSIADGDDSEDDKKLALRNLKKDNDSKLNDLLGIDGAKKYKKKMKKSIRPYKRKMKLLKLAI